MTEKGFRYLKTKDALVDVFSGSEEESKWIS